MTNEEAIKWIEKAGDYSGLLPSEFWHDSNGSPYYEAIDMAIAALRAENKKSILYICDKKKCNEGECLNPECFHTTDPNHRRELEGGSTVFVEDEFGNLWEKIELTLERKEEKAGCMAIQALQKPTGNLISRQAAIEAFCDDCRGLKPGQCEHWDKCKSQKVLRSLPPVTPTERTGEWEEVQGCKSYLCEDGGLIDERIW